MRKKMIMTRTETTSKTCTRTKKYEYKVIDSVVPKRVNITEESFLNKLGEEGWELVEIMGSPFYRYYLKREIIEEDNSLDQDDKLNKL